MSRMPPYEPSKDYAKPPTADLGLPHSTAADEAHIAKAEARVDQLTKEAVARHPNFSHPLGYGVAGLARILTTLRYQEMQDFANGVRARLGVQIGTGMVAEAMLRWAEQVLKEEASKTAGEPKPR